MWLRKPLLQDAEATRSFLDFVLLDKTSASYEHALVPQGFSRTCPLQLRKSPLQMSNSHGQSHIAGPLSQSIADLHRDHLWLLLQPIKKYWNLGASDTMILSAGDWTCGLGNAKHEFLPLNYTQSPEDLHPSPHPYVLNSYLFFLGGGGDFFREELSLFLQEPIHLSLNVTAGEAACMASFDTLSSCCKKPFEN